MTRGLRGTVRVSERAIEAHRLVREAGLSVKDVAARLGCSTGMIHQYVSKVEEAQADERNRRRR